MAKAALARATVSEAHAFFYQRIPKCANRTIINTLMAHSTGYDEARSHSNQLPNLLSYRYMRKSELPWSRGFFCFAFVRDPVDRALSAYLDKVATTHTKGRRYRAILGLDPEAAPNPEEFIAALEQGKLFANPHWAPQTALVVPPLSAVTFFGRVENIESDLQFVCSQSFGFFLGVFNQGSVTSASQRCTELLTPNLVRRLEVLYTRDYELLRLAAR